MSKRSKHDDLLAGRDGDGDRGRGDPGPRVEGAEVSDDGMKLTKPFYVIFMNDGGFPKIVEAETLDEAQDIVSNTYSDHYLIQDRVNNVTVEQSD